MPKGHAVAEIGTGLMSRKPKPRRTANRADSERRMEILRYVDGLLRKYDVGPERFTIYPTLDEIIEGSRKVEAYLEEK